jgi:hypothetical protein
LEYVEEVNGNVAPLTLPSPRKRGEGKIGQKREREQYLTLAPFQGERAG